jgi:hypothetical protein
MNNDLRAKEQAIAHAQSALEVMRYRMQGCEVMDENLRTMLERHIAELSALRDEYIEFFEKLGL